MIESISWSQETLSRRCCPSGAGVGGGRRQEEIGFTKVIVFREKIGKRVIRKMNMPWWKSVSPKVKANVR
jgi:hypothetical protein